jgi:hypothetical protein
VYFHHPVISDQGVKFQYFQWRWGESKNGVKRPVLILRLEDTPFGGLDCIVEEGGYQEEIQPSPETLLTKLLTQANNLYKCTTCCHVLPSERLKDGRCFRCILSNVLCTKEATCSICQKQTLSYYTTGCGHTFHYHCIGKHLETVKKQQDKIEDGELPSADCPNCQVDLETEFSEYFHGD